MNKHPDLAFIDNLKELRATPVVVMELMGLLHDSPGRDIEIAVANKIALDPAMTAFVLKFCNSPLFSHRAPVNTVSRALTMMGFYRLKSILISYFLRTLYAKVGKKYIFNYLWEHSFQVAFISRELATHLDCEEIAEEAYIAGLLHDIGKLVVYCHDPENYEDLLQQVDKERVSLLPLETDTYGYSHTDTGSYLMDLWRLSDLLKHSVQYHHDFDHYRGKEKAVGLVAFANITAHYALGKQDESPEKFLKSFGMSEKRYQLILEDIFRILTESWSMKSKLAILKSEMRRDLEKLAQLFARFASSYQRYNRQKDYAFLVESAFYVNQVYTGFERMFQNVVDSFENTIDDKSWHKSLLDRMTLEPEDIRPPVISETTHRCLNELRAFRHFFRHTYDYDLDDEKFSIVASKTKELKKTTVKTSQNSSTSSITC